MLHRTVQFVCPECGSTHCLPLSLSEALKQGTGRRRGCVCAQCHLKIPLHLAERWGGISFKEARKQWREIYRSIARAADDLCLPPAAFPN